MNPPRWQTTGAWVLRMAWRDGRASGRRLLLAMSSVLLGVAALVAIGSLRNSLRDGIDSQAKALLGADLVIRNPRAWNRETETLIDSVPGQAAREVAFPSMVFFPKSKGARLAQVRAVEDGFPFYGELETWPSEAARTYQSGPNALVEETLLLQFGAKVGDVVEIGAFSYRVAGSLRKVPGEFGTGSIFGARVYVPYAYLKQTRLLQRESLASYRVYFKLYEGIDPEQLATQLEPLTKQHLLDLETVEKRKTSLGRSLRNAYRFLNTVGFMALLLGSIGVASAVHLYIKQKLAVVAVLRCLGARVNQTFAVYLVQVVVISTLAALAGALVGVVIQGVLPFLLRDLLPVPVRFTASWGAISQGVLVGLLIAILFALLPLISIRHASPLSAIRAAYEPRHNHDWLRWVVALLIFLSIMWFGISQSEQPLQGLWLALGLIGAFGLLAGVAKLMMTTVQKFFPSSWSYVWRQGLANLYRPNNQTVLLILSLGLGTFLILTLYSLHGVLLSEVARSSSETQPNLVLFDIQVDQKEEITRLLQSLSIPVHSVAPVVTMRLSAVKGKAVSVLLTDESPQAIPDWALRREYRSTYRADLTETEQVEKGKWISQSKAEPFTPVSVEEGIARRLQVDLGDELVFDVQGVQLPAIVTSLRKVDWDRLMPNFFLVFPEGVLEDAPQIFAIVARTDSSELSATIQRAVFQRFPNVSAIDLDLVLKALDDILGKVAFVIRFMALFSVATGLTVLAASVMTGRYQRMREAVLLRTLGASRSQIIRIVVIEYLFLGSLAALTGMLLSLVATWALAWFVFEASFHPPVLPLVLAPILVSALTLLVGLLCGRGVYNRPPLDVLRSEG
ncbi:MAG: FtsX-like permease family protein [Acidobacteriota bacterium]